MTFEHLLAFNIALLAAIASPRPAFLVAVQTTLNAGRVSGIAVGCGLSLMAATWTLMALLGLEAVFSVFPWLYSIVKLVGAAYLLYIAYNMWVGARRRARSKTRPTSHAFRQGLLLNFLNPKSVLFSAAVLIVVFPAQMSVLEDAAVVLDHLVVELLFYTALAYAMSTRVVSNRYLKVKVYIDRTASVVLGALGLRLLASR